MLAHVPKDEVERCLQPRCLHAAPQELSQIWADLWNDGLPVPGVLVERPSKKNKLILATPRSKAGRPDFQFPVRHRAA
jgi:hypothetical protein